MVDNLVGFQSEAILRLWAEAILRLLQSGLGDGGGGTLGSSLWLGGGGHHDFHQERKMRLYKHNFTKIGCFIIIFIFIFIYELRKFVKHIIKGAFIIAKLKNYFRETEKPENWTYIQIIENQTYFFSSYQIILILKEIFDVLITHFEEYENFTLSGPFLNRLKVQSSLELNPFETHWSIVIEKPLRLFLFSCAVHMNYFQILDSSSRNWRFWLVSSNM